MTRRSSLRRKILIGLLLYTLLLSAAVFVQGMIVNEHAERLVWKTLLKTELDHFSERRASDPDARWANTETLQLFDARDAGGLPESLRAISPGVHDEIWINGRECVILKRNVDGRPLVLALDITNPERHEFSIALGVLASAIAMIALLGIAIAWGARRLTHPLSRLALDIGELQPDRGNRLRIPEDASQELFVIADAFNRYLDRNAHFVERERAFINSASHELRTPIAVIAGATELALDQPGVPDIARKHMTRVRRTTRDIEQLISLLLTLARDPARLSASSDNIALDQLLPDIIDDHRFLMAEKDLELELELELMDVAPITIVAPVQIVQAAIGNLLRNAIENSDRGRISVRLQLDATVVIDDPGHGMSPEEISALYARASRGGHSCEGNRGGGGIGLALVSRLCEHFDWHLDFSPVGRNGTRTTLRFRV